MDNLDEILSELNQEELQELIFSLGDHEEVPVDIDTFLDSGDYMGGYFQGTMFEFWREQLRLIYPDPYTSPYWLISFRGAIGLGKTTIANTIICYEVYKLLCLKSPQLYFGLIETTKILFFLMNSTLGNVSEVGLDQLQQMFLASPVLKAKIDLARDIAKQSKDKSLFPKRVDIGVGSRIGHTLGKALFLCLSGDTIIPLLDGSVDNLESIVSRVQNKEKIYVYSRSPDGDLVPGRITAGLCTGVKEVYRVTLDNGEVVDGTLDHKLMTRSGSYKPIGKLRVGDSLMPFTLDKSPSGYYIHTDDKTSLKEPVHWSISRWKSGARRGRAIHHVNFKKEDNRPENLILVNPHDHIRYHSRKNWILRAKENDPKRYVELQNEVSLRISNYWNNLSAEDKNCRIAELHNKLSNKFNDKTFVECWSNRTRLAWINHPDRENWSNKVSYNLHRYRIDRKEEFIKNSVNNIKNADNWRHSNINKSHITSACRSYWDNATEEQKHQSQVKSKRSAMLKKAYNQFSTGPVDYNKFSFRKETISKYFGDLKEFESCLSNYNHKIINIEYLRTDYVYDITVDKYHNFALSSGVWAHNCFIDEAAFNVVGNQARDNFFSAIRRMQSRFMGEGGGVPGKILFVSSESDKGSDLNSIIDKYKGKKGVLVVQEPIWVVKPHKYNMGVFKVYIGSDTRPPEIIHNESDPNMEHDLILEVPEEHREDFETDVHMALRDLGGVSTGSSYKLFRLKDRLNKSMNVTNLFPDKFRLDFDDDFDLIESHLLFKDYFGSPINPGKPRYIHIDIGLTGDRLGIAASYVNGYMDRKTVNPFTLEEKVEQSPKMITEWAVGIEAVPGKQIPLFKVRMFITWLSQQGYPIGGVSCDGFQSADMLQMLEKMGYNTVLLSVDRTSSPYVNYRSAVYEGRANSPQSKLLKLEFEDVELSPDSKKVDHTADGSKDVSDAVVGSAQNAVDNIDKYRLFEHYAEESKKTKNNKAVRGMFGW